MSERLGQAPDGYHSLNPYIVVTGVDDLVDFLREVFGGVERATERFRRTARSDTPKYRSGIPS